MQLAFFADHDSAVLVSSLASHALNRGETADAVSRSVQDGRTFDADHAVALLDAAAGTCGAAVMLLPLSLLSVPAVRSRLDLPIVIAEDGDEGLRRALEAMKAASPPDRAFAPAWLLANGEAGNAAVRTLPCRSPCFSVGDGLELSAGRTPPGLVRFAVSLAASIYVAAADPTAGTITPSRVSRILSLPGTDAGVALRARLLRLAADLPESKPRSKPPSPYARRLRARSAPDRSMRSQGPSPRRAALSKA